MHLRSGPSAVFLDLDDTILDDSGNLEACWLEACVAHQAEFGALKPAEIQHAILDAAVWYWGDAERHRAGRLRLRDARADVVFLALTRLGVQDKTLARRIADANSDARDRSQCLLAGAVETVTWLRERGVRLALITNGAAEAQRQKVERFRLAPYFDLILVEGELGFGKPDARTYQRALGVLDVVPAQTWMVGDNLDHDVAAPQQLGIRGIWIDRRGEGVPKGRDVRPNAIVRNLAEVRSIENLRFAIEG